MKPWQCDPATYVHNLNDPNDLNEMVVCSHRDCPTELPMRNGYVVWYWDENGNRMAALFCSWRHYLDAICPPSTIH